MNKATERKQEGVLAVWKPAGWTSHDVVAKARRILGIKRIGHTGTLDPAVTGVLPICVGRATRMVEYLQEMPKTYEASLRFGIATDTEDLSGNVIETGDAGHLRQEDITAAVMSFVGPIEQVPPMVSALKVDGKRLYELAREGITIERKPRPVTIHSIDIISLSLNGEFPEVRFSVTCSKGTYIRTLCVDIGRRLGVPAVMAELVRTRSSGLGAENSLTLERMAECKQQGTLAEWFLPADRLLPFIPGTTVDERNALHALQGKPLPLSAVNPVPDREGLWRLYREDGIFLGLFEAELSENLLRASKVFHPEE